MEAKELADIHVGLVEMVVQKYLTHYRNRAYRNHKDDLMGVGYVSLMKAAHKYDPSRNIKFSTYASSTIRNDLHDYVIDLYKQMKSTISIEDIMDTDKEPRINDDEEVDLYSSLVMDMAPENKVQRAVYFSNVVGDNSILDTAEDLNMSRKRVALIKRRVINNIKKKVKETTE